MKVLFAIFAIISFTGIATFGVLSMNHADARGHAGGCVVATISGLGCASKIGSFNFASLHLDFFKNVFAASSGPVFLAELLFGLAALLFWGSGVLLKPFQINLVKQGLSRFSEPPRAPQSPAIISWLALHENSPAYF